jgi:hypothetical protein
VQLFARTGNARNKRQHIFAEPLDDIALRIARSEHRKPASAQAERDDRAAFVVALPPGVGIAAALVGDPSHIAIQGMRERDGVDDDQERRQLRQVLRGPADRGFHPLYLAARRQQPDAVLQLLGPFQLALLVLREQVFPFVAVGWPGRIAADTRHRQQRQRAHRLGQPSTNMRARPDGWRVVEQGQFQLLIA